MIPIILVLFLRALGMHESSLCLGLACCLGQEGRKGEARIWAKFPSTAPHSCLGRRDGLSCFELMVSGTFCVCQAANSGAICLCSQHQHPGINSFLLWFLKEVLEPGGEREEGGLRMSCSLKRWCSLQRDIGGTGVSCRLASC